MLVLPDIDCSWLALRAKPTGLRRKVRARQSRSYQRTVSASGGPQPGGARTHSTSLAASSTARRQDTGRPGIGLANSKPGHWIWREGKMTMKPTSQRKDATLTDEEHT